MTNNNTEQLSKSKSGGKADRVDKIDEFIHFICNTCDVAYNKSTSSLIFRQHDSFSWSDMESMSDVLPLMGEFGEDLSRTKADDDAYCYRVSLYRNKIRANHEVESTEKTIRRNGISYSVIGGVVWAIGNGKYWRAKPEEANCMYKVVMAPKSQPILPDTSMGVNGVMPLLEMINVPEKNYAQLIAAGTSLYRGLKLPVIVFQGSSGSAKSSSVNAISGALIGNGNVGNTAQDNDLPRVLGKSNIYIADNITKLDIKTSNILCRAYSPGEVVTYIPKYMEDVKALELYCLTFMTTIEEMSIRSDLRSRMTFIRPNPVRTTEINSYALDDISHVQRLFMGGVLEIAARLSGLEKPELSDDDKAGVHYAESIYGNERMIEYIYDIKSVSEMLGIPGPAEGHYDGIMSRYISDSPDDVTSHINESKGSLSDAIRDIGTDLVHPYGKRRRDSWKPSELVDYLKEQGYDVPGPRKIATELSMLVYDSLIVETRQTSRGPRIHFVEAS